MEEVKEELQEGKLEGIAEGHRQQQLQYYPHRQEEKQQQQWWERQPEAMMHPSLVELCFHRHNPRLQAQTYLELFHQMLGEGLIDRDKGLHTL